MGLDLDINVEDVIPVLQAAVGSPVYKDKVVITILFLKHAQDCSCSQCKEKTKI